jgi:hypothetical protein
MVKRFETDPPVEFSKPNLELRAAKNSACPRTVTMA